METPREILLFAPPGGEFRKAEYPWLKTLRACIRAGDGGAASDGSPGEKGETVWTLLIGDEIPAELRIAVGRGGRGAPGAKDGEDAFVMLELYDVEVKSQ